MIEEKGGWYVVNVKDARWFGNSAFGKVCSFEKPDERSPDIGVHLFVIEPGKPNCRYHRENTEENFLVLSGECTLLVNDEERPLEAWDYVHCPPNVTHVFVGRGEAPCALLAIGHRKPDHQLFYPENVRARAHGAQAPEPTSDPKVAYSDVPQREESSPGWPC